MRGLLRSARREISERLYLILIWLLLGVCRLAQRFKCWSLPFKVMGVDRTRETWVPILSNQERSRAARIGKRIRRVAPHTPWLSNCLPQALAAWVMLGLCRIPRCLCIGVRRDPITGALNAHAWVVADRVAVTGGSGFDTHMVIASFVVGGR